ncbi:MAG: hypothetical protein JWM48_3095 [Mycobacterium sp.]|nr:hypothetical protein [Mycobacterium sp.]
MTAPEPRTLSSWAAIGLVARREVTVRARSKAFLVTLAILLVGVVATPLILSVTHGSTPAATVGVTGAVTGEAEAIRSAGRAVGQTLSVRTVPDRATGEREVRSGALDALVAGSAPAGSPPGTLAVVVQRSLSPGLANAFAVLARQQALDAQLRQAGADPAAVARSIDAAGVAVQALSPPRTYRGDRLVLGIVVGVLIYLSVLSYGQVVAQSVVEEKTSRVVELLLSTLRPWQLMAGKVLGVGLLGLGQNVLLAVAGGTAAVATGVLSLSIGGAAGVLGLGLLWYVVGFFTFALLFAAIGALVSRQEEVGGAVSPLLMIIIVPYVLAVSILPNNPGSPLVAVLSVVPFASPMTMPERIAIGSASAWQVVLAFALAVVAAVAVVRITGRIYGNAVLRSGARVRLRDALRPQ